MTYKVYYSHFKQLMVVSAYGHILECAIKNVVEVPNSEHVHVQIQDQLMVEKNVMVIEWKRGYVIIISALVSVKLSLCKIRILYRQSFPIDALNIMAIAHIFPA